MVGVAVNVTGSPEQMLVREAAILTEGVTVLFTLITRLSELAVEVVTQLLVEVITTLIVSLLESV